MHSLGLLKLFEIDNLPDDEDLHFPENDFLDHTTGAQYFLHRHATQDLGVTTHIHFFQRWDQHITHLAGLTISESGKPCTWFAVNQWVVGDMWLPAEQTIDLFREWKFSQSFLKKSTTTHRKMHLFLVNLIHSELQQSIRVLLWLRDQKLSDLVDEFPNVNVLEKREREILGSVPCISFSTQDALLELQKSRSMIPKSEKN